MQWQEPEAAAKEKEVGQSQWLQGWIWPTGHRFDIFAVVSEQQLKGSSWKISSHLSRIRQIV